MDFPLQLSKSLFLNGSKDHTVYVNISDPKLEKWQLRDNINKKIKGVYIIFDKMAGTDWETPNPADLKGLERRCIYVGQGKIHKRLSKHSLYNGNIKIFAGEVVYYDIPSKIDRKMLEQLFIKHYLPILNKEDQYEFPLILSYTDSRRSREEYIINTIDVIKDGYNVLLTGKQIMDHFFTKGDMSLNQIEDFLDQSEMTFEKLQDKISQFL
jgi:hypothetical protein